MTANRPQYRLIDLLKVTAAQCIVLHHFSAYGPLSDAAALAMPDTMAWLYDNARMAVQVFLVVAGYLAAKGMSFAAHSFMDALRSLWQRYLRLIVPFGIALLITVLCCAVARPYLDTDLVPHTPTLPQLLAHASLLHSVLNVESLSAGVWYVAIDFQLYAALALLFWVSKGNRLVSVGLVAALAIASLTWFNMDAALDVWAVYFFGAYGLGALARWAGLRARHGIYALGLYCTALTAGIASLVVDFRERVALAISVSAVLASFGSYRMALPRRADRWVKHLSSTSYALFLVHFSVLLLANATWTVLKLQDADLAVGFIALSWLLSVACSHVFHTQIEVRLDQWRKETNPIGVAQPAK